MEFDDTTQTNGSIKLASNSLPPLPKLSMRATGRAERWVGYTADDMRSYARAAIEAALREQLAPKPVAWLDEEINCAYTLAELDGGGADGLLPLYAHPPQRKPLTDEEIHECFQQRSRDKATERRLITRAIERAHGIGGEE